MSVMEPNDETPTRGRVRRSLTNRLVRELARLTAFGTVLLMGLLAVLYAVQARLIFPGAMSQGSREADVDPPPGTELVHLKTRHGERVAALFAPGPDPRRKAAIPTPRGSPPSSTSTATACSSARPSTTSWTPSVASGST